MDQALACEPRAVGKNFSNWSVLNLKVHLHWTVHRVTVWRYMRRLKWRWHRPVPRVASPDRRCCATARYVRRLRAQARRGKIQLYYADEMDMALLPTLRSKIETYRTIWQKLYALKEAGDLLWEHVSKENIANFAALLNQARNLVGINGNYFDPCDYKALIEILDLFGRFEAGKVRLSSIRSIEDESYIWAGEVRSQIEENRAIKMEYKSLLDKVRLSFSRKIKQLAWTGSSPQQKRLLR